jgi:lipoprotein-anchoring transpeptidase ErfK/SrfK
MRARRLASRIFTVLGATMLLTLSASLAWAVVNDYQARGLVPNGVSIAGRDLSGMTEPQARATIEAAVSTPMLRPVTVAAGQKTWTLDAKDFVSIDVDSMLESAYSTRRSATLFRRLDSELRGTPLPNRVKPTYSVNRSAIETWVADVASHVDRKPIDASRTLVGYALRITPGAMGARVDRAAAVRRITKMLDAEAALSHSSRSIALTIRPKSPRVTTADLKTAIVVSLKQCRIYLYDGTSLTATYSCAPGRQGFPTPTGDFHIQTKQTNAPWMNPGTDWAKSMPPMIPPGPDNPMGVRKIGIDPTGVFFHGVPPGEFKSIGTQASHGCMRMLQSDVLDLYNRVHVGDPVFIRE